MRNRLLVLAIFAAKFVTSAVFGGPTDGDLTWQRWLGRQILWTHIIPDHLGTESYSAIGSSWLPQEWLFSTTAALLSGSLASVFAVIVATIAVCALLIGMRRAQARGASDNAQTIMLILAGVALLESFGIRVQVVAWTLLALTMYFLEQDSKKAYFAVLATVLWSNVHASVMLAPVIAAVMTAGSYLDTQLGERTKRLAGITGLLVLATCCNPFGIGLPLYAIHLFSSPFKDLIAEWRHTTIAETSFALGTLPMMLVFLVYGTKSQAPWRDRLVVLTATILMFTAARNIAIYAVLVMPMFAETLTLHIGWLRKQTTEMTKDQMQIKRATPMLAVIIFAFVGTGLYLTASPPKDGQPTAAVAAIIAMPGQHDILCSDFSWCAAFVGIPKNSVYLDGRADPYPQHVWDDYAKIVRIKPTWQDALRKSGTNVVLAANDSTLEEGLSLDGSWKDQYRDKGYTVWTKF